MTDLILYLHNNPTPLVGDTTSQPVLPMDSDVPTATELYNYDADRDDDPGLLIAKGGSGPDEGDPTKYQAWWTSAFTEPLVIQGDATVQLWSSVKDPDGTKGGAVTVYLRDFDGESYVELGRYTVTDPNWQGGARWVQKPFTFSVGPHTVAAGNSLELKVIVEPWSADDMWFAYDTNDHKSRVTVSVSAATLALDIGPAASWLSRISAQTLLRWRYS